MIRKIDRSIARGIAHSLECRFNSKVVVSDRDKSIANIKSKLHSNMQVNKIIRGILND